MTDLLNVPVLFFSRFVLRKSSGVASFKQQVVAAAGGGGTIALAPRYGSMPQGATLATVRTYRAHAERLTLYAAAASDPAGRAEFAALAREWERLTDLAEWQMTVMAAPG